MSEQGALFYEDIFDVVRAMVQAAGGAKVVASKLWPNMPLAEAHRKLLDCMNRGRPEKLCIEEFLAVVRMAREANFHQGKHWIDADTGYQPTPPTDPVVERDRLAERVAQLAEATKDVQRQMERLGQQGIRAVK